MILLDTSVLVYAINADAPQHAASRRVVEAAIAGRLPAVLVPQVLVEFVAVVTHRRRVKQPLSSEQAWGQAAVLRTALPVLDLHADVLTILGEFVATARPTGSAIFDLFLAAQMRHHNVGTICTENPRDFTRVPGIAVFSAADLLVYLGLD